MKRNKLNKIISCALVAAYASHLTPIYAADINIETKTNLEENTVKDQFTDTKNESINWLDKVIAEKLNKEVSDLTEDDYLSITSLDLSGKDILSNIPSNISKLKNLKSLNLSLTGLTGSIPAEIKELTKLETLILYGNELTGSIPEELYEITSLKSIELMNNNLSGTISSKIGNLINLEKFAVGGNKITGSIPSEICNLTNLSYLDLEGNSISGSLPSDLGNMISLEVILLGQTEISGSIPSSIGNLAKLKYLEIYETNLTGEIPSSIGSLKSLNTLRLRSNKLTGSIPSEIGNLSTVVNIELHDNNLTGEIPASICKLTQLEGLSLQDNNLTGELPSNIGNLKNLIRINVENNMLSGEIPESIVNLTNIKFQPATFYSSFANNQFTGKLPTEMVDKLNSTIAFENNFIENMSKQKSIYFSKTPTISVKLGEKLSEDSIINNISIKDSKGRITGETLSSYLKYSIDVGGVGVFDSNGIAVKNINTTIRAYIENTNVLTTNKLTLNTYNDNVENNWVNKEVARQVGKLYTELLPEDYLKIKEIDLSNKNITGVIPSDLYKLTNLTSLNLSNNNITGTFPTELKSLTNLKELDLSYNNITGELPNLSILENVNVLKVNNNLLTGAVPTSSELNKLDLNNSSFADNQLSGEISEDLLNATTEEAFKDNLISNLNNQKTIEVKEKLLKVKLGNRVDTTINNNDVVIVKNNGNRSNELLDSEYKLIVNLKNNEIISNDIAIKTGKTEFKVSILGTTIESLNTIKVEAYNDVINENWLTREIAKQLNKDVKDLIVSDYSKITKIDLSNSNLEGTIPSELSKLTNLQELDLSNNKLTGQIPSYIFETNLIKCNLSNNLFYGKVLNTYTKSISEYDLSNNFLNNIENQYQIILENLDSINLNEKESINKNSLIEKIKVVDINGNEITLPSNFKIEIDTNNSEVISKDLKANKVGKTTLNVYLKNTNDNTIIISKENAITVTIEDTTKPTISAKVSNSKWTNKNVNITVTATDNDKVSKIQLPNGKFVNTNETAYTVNKNGNYVFIAYDESGNTSEIKVSVQNIDTTKPTATVSIAKPDKNNKVAITVKPTDKNSGLDKVTFNGKEYAAKSSHKFEVTKNGTYTLTVTDKAGNKNTYNVKVSSIKDTTKPTITAKKSTSSWTNKNVTITVTASDNDKISKIKLPNGKFVNSNKTTYTVSSNGNYTFTAYDASGNASSIKVSVQNIDKTKPTVTTSIAKPDKNKKVAITVKPTDKNSGLNKVTFNGKEYSAKSSHKFEVTKNGTYTLTVTDKAGNKNTYNVKVSSIK